MLRRWIPVVSVSALVVVGLSLIAETAGAGPFGRFPRDRNRFYNEPVSYYEGSQPVTSQPTTVSQGQSVVVQEPVYTSRRGLLRRGYATTYYVPSTQPSSVPQGTGYRSYYFTPTADVPAGSVLLNVLVPPDAQIWLDGNKTSQTGANRSFVSPPLTAGKHYTYEVKARWMSGGTEINRTRKVMVHAGEAIDIDLSRPTRDELQQEREQR